MCKKKYPIKRYFLPTIGVSSLLVFEDTQDFLYVPLIMCYCFFILFWNYPKLVYFTNTKPIYYEDIFINVLHSPKINETVIDLKVKKRFEKIFTWTLIIMNTLLMGALSDFWLYKTQELDGYTEVIGITGGILKLFQFLNTLIGSLLIRIIRKHITKKYRNRAITHHTIIDVPCVNTGKNKFLNKSNHKNILMKNPIYDKKLTINSCDENIKITS